VVRLWRVSKYYTILQGHQVSVHESRSVVWLVLKPAVSLFAAGLRTPHRKCRIRRAQYIAEISHLNDNLELEVGFWGLPVLKAADAQKLEIAIPDTAPVSALLIRPRDARAAYVFAHGAGAGMTHASMEVIAAGLGNRGIATLRYQFPYMENGSKRPDSPAVAHAAVRAAVAEAGRCCAGLPLVAGGKSFGGRMTSQAQAFSPLPGVRGLAFLGFPLHPAGKPSRDRAKHLADIRIPLLFLQGTRDALAELSLLEPVVKGLGRLATLHLVKEADHSFHVLKRSGRNDGEVLDEVLDAFAAWVDGIQPSG
jgi:predicted alpha/beta-hydrolase family hydrolase